MLQNIIFVIGNNLWGFVRAGFLIFLLVHLASLPLLAGDSECGAFPQAFATPVDVPLLLAGDSLL